MVRTSSEGMNRDGSGGTNLGALLAGQLDGLYRLALRLTTRPQQAEDLLHDTVVKGIERFHQLRDVERFRPWIYRIMVNEYLNAYSRNKAEEKLIMSYADQDYLDNLAAMEAPWESVEESALRALNWERLYPLFMEIPAVYRIVLWCYYIEEMTLDEIAEMHEIPRGTAASRLYRARQILMKKLNSPAKETHH